MKAPQAVHEILCCAKDEIPTLRVGMLLYDRRDMRTAVKVREEPR